VLRNKSRNCRDKTRKWKLHNQSQQKQHLLVFTRQRSAISLPNIPQIQQMIQKPDLVTLFSVIHKILSKVQQLKIWNLIKLVNLIVFLFVLSHTESKEFHSLALHLANPIVVNAEMGLVGFTALELNRIADFIEMNVGAYLGLLARSKVVKLNYWTLI
jgi:hypothetical protein